MSSSLSMWTTQYAKQETIRSYLLDCLCPSLNRNGPKMSISQSVNRGAWFAVTANRVAFEECLANACSSCRWHKHEFEMKQLIYLLASASPLTIMDYRVKSAAKWAWYLLWWSMMRLVRWLYLGSRNAFFLREIAGNESPSHHETTMLVKKWVGACDGVAFWDRGGYGFVPPLLVVAKRLKFVYCRCEKNA